MTWVWARRCRYSSYLLVTSYIIVLISFSFLFLFLFSSFLFSQAISLVLTNRPDPEGEHRTTLVVCPVVALVQWHTEILKYTKPDTLKILLYPFVRDYLVNIRGWREGESIKGGREDGLGGEGDVILSSLMYSRIMGLIGRVNHR